MRRRRRESHGWRVLLLSGRVTGSREGGGYPTPVGRLRLRPRNWVALATTNGQSVSMSGRRVEPKGGTRRRMAMSFRWVRFELSLRSVWTRRARFPGARALGGSSAWRLGGLSGRQLTGHRPSGQWQRGPGNGFALERCIAPLSRAAEREFRRFLLICAKPGKRFNFRAYARNFVFMGLLRSPRGD